MIIETHKVEFDSEILMESLLTLVCFSLISCLILSEQFVLSDLTACMSCQHVVILVLDVGRVCQSLEQPLAIVELAHRAELALRNR